MRGGGGERGEGDGRQVDTHLEVGELSESLLTARMWALVGSVACVDSARAGPGEAVAQSHPRAGPVPKPSCGQH